jgi:hypothetical protein
MWVGVERDIDLGEALHVGAPLSVRHHADARSIYFALDELPQNRLQ